MAATTKSSVFQSGPKPRRRAAPRHDAARNAGSLPWKAVFEERSRIIDLMAAGTPLKDVLTAIARMVEKLAPPALCSVLLLQPDGKHLRHGAGPSLPDDYSRAINGLEIGPSVGSCGTAAYRKTPVIVSDIATDPLWEGPREFALSFGLRACWSMPIIGNAGVVLGTIAMYYRQPREPSARDFGLLQPGAGLVRLALAQHRKEQELSASEARTRLAVEAADLGTYDVDLVSGAMVWSARFKEILGLPADIEPTHDELGSLVHPEDRARFNSTFEEWTTTGMPRPRGYEYRFRRADNGAERVILLPGRVLFNAQEVPVRAVGVAVDITAQRAAERTRREIEGKIHELQKMEAIGQLAGGIAHDLNNTLMPILGLSKLAMQELPPLDPLAETLALIHRSGERARDLVNQLLTFSRKDEIARGPVALASLVDESLPLLRVGLPVGVNIAAEISGDPTIWANRGQVDQVLTNLVNNAAQAIGARGGRIRIEVAADGKSRLARLSVIDDGPGINPAVRQRLFEPFFTTKPVGAGTGLGLAVAHGIVVNHGGRIEVTSEVGKGAAFHVYLPLLKSAEPASVAQLEHAD